MTIGVSASIVREDEVQVKTEPIEIVEANLAAKLDNIIINISDDDDDIVPHYVKLLKSGDY